jgi:hypothetical protein
MAITKKEYEKKWAQVVAKAWADENFKQKLLKNPAAALKEMGVQLPPDRKVEIHESTDRVTHLILPPRPEEELSEKELHAIAAGTSHGWT